MVGNKNRHDIAGTAKLCSPDPGPGTPGAVRNPDPPDNHRQPGSREERGTVQGVPRGLSVLQKNTAANKIPVRLFCFLPEFIPDFSCEGLETGTDDSKSDDDGGEKNLHEIKDLLNVSSDTRPEFTDR